MERCLQHYPSRKRRFPMTILRQRVTEDMQIRNLSPCTQATYLQQITQFACYFGKSPDLLGLEDIRAYLIYLTNERKLAPSSIHIAVGALRFFYKVTLKREWTFAEALPLPKKPQKLPIILSPEEVLHFLPCVNDLKHRVILTTCYAAGLRISESVRLQAPCIDSKRMVIRVVQGKGRKDRYVMLSPKLLEILRNYYKAERPKEWLFPGGQPGQPISAKPPFAGPDDVLRYAARYTHRVAVSNDRVFDIEDDKVQFRWKDYRDACKKKTIILAAEEFIRRFLLHVLPEGFQRIRYYGFLANRYRKQKLARCRELLNIPPPEPHCHVKKNYRDRYG